LIQCYHTNHVFLSHYAAKTFAAGVPWDSLVMRMYCWRLRTMSKQLSQFSKAQRLNLDDVLSEFGADLPPNGDCPHAQECEQERQQLPYYMPIRCHWRAWGDWKRCPQLNGRIT
jgi:hypothetical protein